MIAPMSRATPLTSKQINAFTAALVQAVHDEIVGRTMSMSDLAARAGMPQERLRDRLEKRDSTSGPIVMNVRDKRCRSATDWGSRPRSWCVVRGDLSTE